MPHTVAADPDDAPGERAAVAPGVDERWWIRGLMLLGVSALAIAQPLLDLFGRNAEFFVAGNYTRTQIVVFALVVTFLPAALATALTAAVSAVDDRAGTVVFRVLLAAFAGLFALALLHSLGVANVAVVAVLAMLIAGGVAVAVARARAARLLLQYLSVASVAFLALFLVASPVSSLVFEGRSAQAGSAAVPPLDGPVVVIVLDELPAATLIRADGTINADRYPAFAELADVSTWFRNASSRDVLTNRSVPSIMNGLVDNRETLPTAADHPRTLLSLLGHDVPIHRYESVTDLCPSSICEPPAPQPLRQAFEDAALVYGHRVLPPSLSDDLAPIDNAWGSFGEGGSAPSTQDIVTQSYSKWHALDVSESSPLGQAGILRDEGTAVTGEPALHFIHVALPHHPWTLTGEGASLADQPASVEDPDSVTDEFGARLEYQLHSMQVGAADAVLGEILDHLRALSEWDDTLLVVTSDHGMNFTLPDLGRTVVTEANADEVYRIPLFIKAPGQLDGAVDDSSAQTIDVLPSVIDLLGADVDWELDGHSLYDGSTATIEPLVSSDVASLLAIAERRDADFPHGDDWLALAAVGANGDLVGQAVDELETGAQSRYRAELDQRALFAELPTDSGEIPLYLTGRVEPADDNASDVPASELVVAINGRIAGVVGGFSPDDDGWRMSGYVADVYREGSNDVAVYEVQRSGATVTLLPTAG